MKVKEGENVGLKLNIQKTKIMAPGTIISWEIDGETVETVSDFFGGAPKSLLMVIAAMKLMHDTRCLGLVHWDDPEGWYQEGGGKGGSG